jgi:hypothetical protein
MDMRIDNFKTSRMMFRAKAVMLSLVVAGVVYAAATFVPNDQPWGYIAPPALSSSNFQKNNVVAFTPWFEEGSFMGDLIAYPVGADGSVSLLIPNWRASTDLNVANYLNGRSIATTDGDGTAMPFLYGDLTPVQQSMVGSADVVNYVRGDRSNEGIGFRTRNGVMGNIVHTTPVYLGKPIGGYVFGDYLQFAEDNATRAARVFAGANDGMLHAFDAVLGTEVFAYVPSMVIPNLPKLTAIPYEHQYFVDGFLTLEDVQWADTWHSVLVGGLGAGGKGYYALDVTSPDAANDNDAADKILWELHSGSDNAGNIGYSYSRPSIIRLKTEGVWAAVFGNGYMSSTGAASLFVVNIETGAVIRELVVSGGSDNGLSSPTVVDADFDGYPDTAYAGDLNGNVWKFDLEDANKDNWSVALGGWPLFTTTAGQAITTSPEIGRHPLGEGVMVYIGTGRLFDANDGSDKTTQSAYGLWDNGSTVSLSSLIRQTLTGTNHINDAAVRVVTDNRPDWETHEGWVTDLETAGATVLDQGERIMQDMLLRDGRVYLMSTNPTVGTGDNWFIQLNADTGGAPYKIIVDIDNDQLLNESDNVDVNGDLKQTAPEERVVGQYQNFGLASRPVVGTLSTTKDSALINHLSAVTPYKTSPVPDPLDPLEPIPPGEYGLVGGHFDLDTSSQIYDFDLGVTDGHVHEWDDKHDLTTVNFMDLLDGGGLPLDEITDSAVGDDDIFMLIVANTDLSPGGMIEINGSTMTVWEYANAVDLYLTTGNQKFLPRYKIGVPTEAEKKEKVQQLTSLKISFDAYTLINGGLIPTATGCVRGNNPGINGEYRNGALMLQALDMSDADELVLNEGTNIYENDSAGVDGALGYATKGLFWESTLFWHWDGDCYGAGTWLEDYTACYIDNTVDCVGVTDAEAAKAESTKSGKKGKKSGGGKGGDPIEEVPVEETDPAPDDTTGGEIVVDPTDPGHNVSNTTVGGANDVGRLFWKELIPQE